MWTSKEKKIYKGKKLSEASGVIAFIFRSLAGKVSKNLTRENGASHKGGEGNIGLLPTRKKEKKLFITCSSS